MRLGMEGSSPEGAHGKENMEQATDEGSKEHDQQKQGTSQKVVLVELEPFKSWSVPVGNLEGKEVMV